LQCGENDERFLEEYGKEVCFKVKKMRDDCDRDCSESVRQGGEVKKLPSKAETVLCSATNADHV